jgi:hypothetical protein
MTNGGHNLNPNHPVEDDNTVQDRKSPKYCHLLIGSLSISTTRKYVVRIS